MSAMDKIRSFAEARSEDAELLPPGCLSYGDAREIIALGEAPMTPEDLRKIAAEVRKVRPFNW